MNKKHPVTLMCYVCSKPVSKTALNSQFNKHPNKEIAFCSKECERKTEKASLEALKETIKLRGF